MIETTFMLDHSGSLTVLALRPLGVGDLLAIYKGQVMMGHVLLGHYRSKYNDDLCGWMPAEPDVERAIPALLKE